MWILFRADLQALWNLRRFREGRAVLVGSLSVQALLAVLAIGPSVAIFEHSDMRLRLEDRFAGEQNYAAILALCLVPAMFFAITTSLRSGERFLFHGPSSELLLTAPRSAGLVLLRAFFRCHFFVLFWSLLLCGIPMFFLQEAAHSGHLGLVALPFTIVLGAAPVVAGLLLLHVVLMRWFANPRVKLAAGIVSSVLYLLLFGGLLLGGQEIGDQGQQARDVLTDPEGRLRRAAAMFTAPAALLRVFEGVPLAAEHGFALARGLGVAGLALLLALPLLRRAFENERMASEPLLRRRAARALRGGWPSHVWSSVLRKDFALLLQRPGGLLGVFLSVAILMYLLARGGLGRGLFASAANGSASDALAAVQGAVAMLGVWYWMIAITLPGQSARIIEGDRRQWGLLMASPADRDQVLRGKLGILYALALPYSLGVMAVAVYAHEVPWTCLLLFAGLVPPLLFTTTNLSAAIATLPVLMRPSSNGGEAPAFRTGGLVMLQVLGLLVLLLIGVLAWFLLASLLPGPGSRNSAAWARAIGLTFGVFWFLGLLLGSLASAWARRNFRVLLEPRWD